MNKKDKNEMSVEEMMKRLDENDGRENIKTEEYDYLEDYVKLMNKLLKVESGEKEEQIVKDFFNCSDKEFNNKDHVKNTQPQIKAWQFLRALWTIRDLVKTEVT
jgi:hypothetical protein